MQRIFFFLFSFLFFFPLLLVGKLQASASDSYSSSIEKNLFMPQASPDMKESYFFELQEENGPSVYSLESHFSDSWGEDLINEVWLSTDQGEKEFLEGDWLQDSTSLRDLWFNFYNVFYSFYQYVEQTVYQIGEKCRIEIPVPLFASQALEKIGRTLFGDTTYLLMGNHYEPTHVACYGKHEISDKVRVTFINGILNTSATMQGNLEMLSEMHGGTNIHYVFRPTEGWTRDIWRAIMIKTAFSLGFRSMHAYLLAKKWKELIQEMGGPEGGGMIVHYAHSLGGSETDRAREILNPEEQKMIRVITFGSSTLIRNVGFESVVNIVSVNDGVSSFFLEPFGHVRNYFDPETNVRFYSFPDAPCWPKDHLLNGPTYGPILLEFGKKFSLEFAPTNL